MRQTPTLLTTIDVMPKLGFSTPDGVIGYLRRQGLTPVRVGRRLLWRADAVERLMASLEQGESRS